MSQAINYTDALIQVDNMVEDGWNNEDIFNHLIEEGFSKKQVVNLFTETGLIHPAEKTKNQSVRRTPQSLQSEDNNPMEDALGGLLSLAIKYGLPLILIVFGLAYVGSEMSRDFEVGIRSAAAAIMPLAVTLAFAKSEARHGAMDFFSENQWVAFAFSFALAMTAAAGAMWMRDFNNIIPIGELAFSTTLSLMIFGNKDNGDVSFVHVGAVTGLLTYVVFFGVGL